MFASRPRFIRLGLHGSFGSGSLRRITEAASTRVLQPSQAPALGVGLVSAFVPSALALGFHVAAKRCSSDGAQPPAALRPEPGENEADAAQWNQVIAAALPAVVSIKVNRVRAFDTSSAGTIQGTGFVVDKDRGYIMTNRHIAGPGPVIAEAIFVNNEEVPLTVAYYDPVHDFALCKFDPAALKHMEVVEIRLAPEEAERSSEIVIIGNNAGEKCSISRTLLARLDRNAPAYNRNGYNDFNTFYMHSLSGTTGGSSGSPVLNSRGHAIALNAGGKVGTTAGFFLPLDRAKRALHLLQAGQPVERGTLQAVFTHQPLDEAARLGLPPSIEAELRRRHERLRGMLVVSEVLPDGPADGGLRPGDILLRLGDEYVYSFVQIEKALDGNVGGEVTLHVCRGGESVSSTLRVDDLHALTPSSFFELGGAVVHDLSYQQARNHGIPVRGVYVAHPGYMLRQAKVTRGCIVSAVGGVPTPTLKDFTRQMAATPHGTQLIVRFFDLGHRSHVQLCATRMDSNHWFPLSFAERLHPKGAPVPRASPAATAATGAGAGVGVGGGSPDWEVRHMEVCHSEGAIAGPICGRSEAQKGEGGGENEGGGTPPPRSPAEIVEIAAPNAGALAAPSAASEASSASAATQQATPLQGKRSAAQVLSTSLVTVDFSRPFCVDGEVGMRYRGTGLVLDADRGIVVADRNTVTTTLGDVSVTFGGKATVGAKVIYVHPVHNFGLVQYDPSLLPDGVKVQPALLEPRQLKVGAPVWLVGLKSGLNEEFDTSRRVDFVSRKTRVANCGWMKLPLPNPPRYQISNVETVGLEVAPSMDGGVVADEAGAVLALWTSCSYQASQNQTGQVFRGIPIHLIKSISDCISSAKPLPLHRSLGATFEPVSLATARQLGMTDAALERLGSLTTAPSSSSAEASSILLVSHMQTGSPCNGVLRGGDLLSTIDRAPIRSLGEAEQALQGAASVVVTVVRDGEELTLSCDTQEHSYLGTERVVGWAGLLLQATPDAVRTQRDVPEAGVYASYRFYGSPASRYDLSPTSHIIEVDSTPTPDLDAFIACTKQKRNGDVLRLKYVDLEGRQRMTTIKLDLKWWPTYQLERSADGTWRRAQV